MYGTLFLFIALATTAFFGDVGIFFLYHDQFLYLILYLYIFELLSARRTSHLILFGALMSLESFIFYSTLWAPLIALIPLTITEIQVRHNFYQSWGYAMGVGISFILTQMLVIEPFFVGLPLGLGYTILKLCANIGIVGIISLKNYYQDKRDNREVRF